MEIQFASRWLERCVRDYLGIADGAVTEEDVSVIKYLYVSTTNGYFLGFGKGVLPDDFMFSDAGDEWNVCCLHNTAKYAAIEEFLDIADWGNCKEISIKEALPEDGFDDVAYGNEEDLSDDECDAEEASDKERPGDEASDDGDTGSAGMEEFEGSVKIYETQDSDFEGLVQDEETYDYGVLSPDDFSHFTNLEVVRLMSCETEIHSLAFLKALPKLRILEVGEVRLNTLDGLEKLIGLEKLCVWSN